MIRWIWEKVIGGHWHDWEYAAPFFCEPPWSVEHGDCRVEGQVMRCNSCGQRRHVVLSRHRTDMWQYPEPPK